MLFEYRTSDSPLWAREEESSAGADVILAGHTHLPFVREIGSRLIANPGSLGQSKAGDPHARYALWQDDHFELKAYEYPVESTVRKILALRLSDDVKSDLIRTLRTGKTP
jgi:protein phosphatase